MGSHVDIAGHPTWVEDRGGPGDPVLLLHGGLGDSDLLLDVVGPALADRHRLVAFDRRGHGRTADTAAPFHYADMAAEAIGVLEAVVGGPAHLVGYSDGGVTSLLVALERPDLVHSMALLGTNAHHEGLVPGAIDDGGEDDGGGGGEDDGGGFEEVVRSYGRKSPDGPSHFEVVMTKFVAMCTAEPTLTADDLARITRPVLLVVGDDDIVTLPHATWMLEALPAAQLAVLPGASHAAPLEQPSAIAALVGAFVGAPPPRTMMPLRRRPGRHGDAPRPAPEP